MRKAGWTILALGCLFLGGCVTAAGPFVTNVTSDGKGDIIVEKNMVQVDAFSGTVSVGDQPTTEVIKVFARPKNVPPLP